MRVIGAGFGRTGTLSLKAALEELGFGPCYHMTEVFDRPSDLSLWGAAVRGEPVDWEKLLGGYEAAVDWPACAFYETLMERYPDAKVVLTVRDPQRWYESTYNTIYAVRGKIHSSLASRAFLLFAQTLVPPLGRLLRMVDEVVWQGTFDGKFEDRSRAIEIFNRHIGEVKERVPPDRLLVYDVGEGWGPLCAFLGVETPDGRPFPRLNDSVAFRRNVLLGQALVLCATVLGAVLILLASRRLTGGGIPLRP